MKTSLWGVFALFSALSMICMPEVYAQHGTPAYSDVDLIFQARCIKCHSGTRPRGPPAADLRQRYRRRQGRTGHCPGRTREKANS